MRQNLGSGQFLGDACHVLFGTGQPGFAAVVVLGGHAGACVHQDEYVQVGGRRGASCPGPPRAESSKEQEYDGGGAGDG
ncbi:hypothetical protein AAHB34_11470 [Paenarthrobacter ureafaciens]